MVIPVTCACGRGIKAPDHLAGKKARCPACGKPIAIPAPGEPEVAAAPGGPIPVTCACGKTLRAPATLAGKKAKCPGCGNVIAIPAPAAEVSAPPPPEPEPEPEPEPDPEPEPEPPAEEEAPAPARPGRGRLPRRGAGAGGRLGARPGRRGQAGARRGRREPQERQPMPGLAMALGVLALLESLGVGLLAFGLTVLGGLFAGGSQELGTQLEGFEFPSPEEKIAEIRQGGGTITKDEVVDEDGVKVRNVEWTMPDGTQGGYSGPVGDELKDLGATTKDVGTAIGGIIMIIGLSLGGVCLFKVICCIAFFMKKNWARIGLVVLSVLEALLVLLAVFGGGGPMIFLGGLVVPVLIVFYFMTSSVKAACR